MPENSFDRRGSEIPCQLCHQWQCRCTREQTIARKALGYYEVIPERSAIIFKDKHTLEQAITDGIPERKLYGSLPYFSQRDTILRHFASEDRYFGKYYDPRTDPRRRGRLNAEGMLFYEMKFGERLSVFTDSVLAHYPKKTSPGRDISLFGLSGSGKSTALSAMREYLGPEAIFMDNDTARYNLLAKKVRDAEMKNGVGLEEVRNNLMHNALSSPLYFLLNHVARELSGRGYQVVRSAVQPGDSSDTIIYLEHPDGIDPRHITDDELPEAAHTLYERTHGRLHERDTYDWAHAETVTDFRAMKDVSVDVPERSHLTMLKSLRTTLSDPRYRDIPILKNEKTTDAIERKEKIFQQLEKIFGKKKI